MEDEPQQSRWTASPSSLPGEEAGSAASDHGLPACLPGKGAASEASEASCLDPDLSGPHAGEAGEV